MGPDHLTRIATSGSHSAAVLRSKPDIIPLRSDSGSVRPRGAGVGLIFSECWIVYRATYAWPLAGEVQGDITIGAYLSAGFDLEKATPVLVSR